MARIPSPCTTSRFVEEPDEVLHEPENLIKENPGLRPADTALSHESIGNQTFNYTLIDYTTAVRANNSPTIPQVATSTPMTAQVTMLHEEAENSKLHGPSNRTPRYPITAEDLIRKLN